MLQACDLLFVWDVWIICIVHNECDLRLTGGVGCYAAEGARFGGGESLPERGAQTHRGRADHERRRRDRRGKVMTSRS